MIGNKRIKIPQSDADYLNVYTALKWFKISTQVDLRSWYWLAVWQTTVSETEDNNLGFILSESMDD